MNVGILGAGHIANKMALTLTRLEGVTAFAAASRDLAKSKAFADQYHIPHAYGSYREMLENPDINLVYVATLHAFHFEHVKLCLEYGKHVLCEKTFMINADQAKEVIALGRQKKLLVAEAMWSRHLPIQKKLNEVLSSGVIGKPRALSVNLCYPVFGLERLVKPELGGGALFDTGIYPVTFALLNFGHDIERIDSSAVLHESGVDAASNTTFTYRDGRQAALYTSMFCKGDKHGVIYGENGFIDVPNFNNPISIGVYDVNEKLIAEYERPPQITGFEYEVLSCKKAIEENRIECPELDHAEIIRVMEILDKLRSLWGVKYPGE
jgi:predicted dehydrogenase